MFPRAPPHLKLNLNIHLSCMYPSISEYRYAQVSSFSAINMPQVLKQRSMRMSASTQPTMLSNYACRCPLVLSASPLCPHLYPAIIPCRCHHVSMYTYPASICIYPIILPQVSACTQSFFPKVSMCIQPSFADGDLCTRPSFPAAFHM